MSNTLKHIADLIAAALAAVALIATKFIPVIAGMLSIAWYVTRFYKEWKSKKDK